MCIYTVVRCILYTCRASQAIELTIYDIGANVGSVYTCFSFRANRTLGWCAGVDPVALHLDFSRSLPFSVQAGGFGQERSPQKKRGALFWGIVIVMLFFDSQEPITEGWSLPHMRQKERQTTVMLRNLPTGCASPFGPRQRTNTDEN